MIMGKGTACIPNQKFIQLNKCVSNTDLNILRDSAYTTLGGKLTIL